jgi:hypothetical protein
MFEQIFEEYRNAVDSSLQMQQEMYRQWMNGWPIKPSDVANGPAAGSIAEQVASYRREWSSKLAEAMDRHREVLNAQYKAGIDAIQSAFKTADARTPEEYWRLTQEFWRKSIDSFKTAYESQSKYLQSLAEMWMEMITRGKV